MPNEDHEAFCELMEEISSDDETKEEIDNGNSNRNTE